MASIVGFSRLLNFGLNNCAKQFNNNNFLTTKNPLVCRLWNLQVAGVKHRVPWFWKDPEYQAIVPNISKTDKKIATDVMAEINNQIATDKTGRLFAVVHICGKQFKVTTNDIIVIQGYWPPNSGDELNLEKILLVGSTDFTLIGRPILNKELVSVDATVIGKTFSPTKTRFNFIPRQQHRRINFARIQQTMLRINSINIIGKVGEKKEVEGLNKVF